MFFFSLRCTYNKSVSTRHKKKCKQHKGKAKPNFQAQKEIYKKNEKFQFMLMRIKTDIIACTVQVCDRHLYNHLSHPISLQNNPPGWKANVEIKHHKRRRKARKWFLIINILNAKRVSEIRMLETCKFTKFPWEQTSWNG